MRYAQILLIIYILINIVTFCVYYMDKSKAKRNKWRISELTLLLLAFCGGAVGALAAMILFHHKIRKLKFRLLVPFFMIVQIILIAGVCKIDQLL